MMRFEPLAGLAASQIFAAFALTLAPLWWRPGTYFGVSVAPEYRGTPQARQTRRRFTVTVWIATFLAMVVSLSSAQAGIQQMVVAGFLVQLGGAIVAFRSGWRETKPHAVPAPSIRSAHLLAAPPRVPGGVAAVVMPFVILAGVSAYLLANWDSIPARFPIHWDFNGNANGWRDRSPMGVFGPVLIAFLLLVLIGGVGAFTRAGVQRAPTGSGLERRNRAILGVLVLVMWTMAIMFSLAALTPLIVQNGQFPIPAFVLLLIPLGVVAASIWWVARASTEADGLPADPTPDECWKWGLFYYNPNDTSLIVEKRFGIGHTLNFAHWQSWALLAALLAPLVVIMLISRSG